jgi:hypothetical protein
VYEVALPFCDLTNLEGDDGERFGLSFLVNDDDGAGREGWLEWTVGIGAGKDPSAFGQATLVEGPGGGPLECEEDASYRSPYGINTHLPSGAELTTLYDLTRDAGIAWVRVDFNWGDAEPSQDHFDWSRYDAVVRAAAERGLHVYAGLGYTPGWANGGRDGTVPPSSPDDWRDFCRRVAERYDGAHGLPRIEHFGMWNEPDHEGFFTGTVDDYIETILVNGAEAVRAGNPDAQVCAPDLAHDLDFLREVLERGRGLIDVVTIHKYAERARDYGTWLDGAHWPWEDDNVREILTATGFYPGTPVWLTECGWPTDPGWVCWFDHRQSEEGQATRYGELLDTLASREWVQRYFFYELRDADLTEACQWGILRGDLSPKPAYGAYRDYIAAHPR